ncbi:bifunctional tetrahydrofolate synthase/dihydrofolate synthase [Thiolapillus sp.]
MRFTRLDDWLNWQEGLNPKTVDLGLERAQQVWSKLTPPDLASSTVISIAGTNGKGSTVALFEAILRQAGYSTGSYTSPHLLRYNERIRLDGIPVSDEQIIEAFQVIDAAREDIPLTYFEYGTLAALYVFSRQAPDVVLLEVGLGGRLDAVNIIDADLAMITSIALDHQEWLGNDRESIGREKAGIFRPGKPAVFAGRDMPESIAGEAEKRQTRLYVHGRDYYHEESANLWNWNGPSRLLQDLPFPALPGSHQLDNAAAVLMAFELLSHTVPVSQTAISQGLKTVSLSGRQQLLEKGGVEWILDVAHNPHAVAALQLRLQENPVSGRTLAVLGMLRDKDVAAVLALMQERVQKWHFATIEDSRGMTAKALAGKAREMSRRLPLETHESIEKAMQAVAGEVDPGDRVVVFGSFFTVADALKSSVINRCYAPPSIADLGL